MTKPAKENPVEHRRKPPSSSSEWDGAAARQTLPMMPLRNLVIFPGMIQSLAVGRPKSLALTQRAAMSEGKLFFVAAQKETEEEDPAFGAIYHIGCVVRILKLKQEADGTQTTLVQGVVRAKAVTLVSDDPYYVVEADKRHQFVVCKDI